MSRKTHGANNTYLRNDLQLISKKYFILLLTIFQLQISRIDAQNSVSQKIKTYSLGGQYSFGANIDKGSIGLVYVYPESDSTVLFFIDVNRGAPSYNMGNLYGRLKVKSGVGVFTKNIAGEKKSCVLEFKFQSNNLNILTLADNDNCGFGYAVFADGTYKRSSKKIPQYFISMTGEKHFFKETDPNTWEND